MFEDAMGYLRLGIDKKKKLLQPLLSFSLLAEAHNTLWQWVREHNLHPALCFLDKSNKTLDGLPTVEEHNAVIDRILKSVKEEKKTYLIKETGDNYILVEEGRFYGMGKIEDAQLIAQLEQLKLMLTPYPENEVIRSMLKTHVERYPMCVMMLE